jgi:AcrR family transcriptional regulator
MATSFRQEQQESGRDVIVRAATLLFGGRGYQGASMRLLAQQLGITAPSLYHHFSSKEALLFAVLEDNQRDFLATTEAAVAEASPEPEGQLAALVASHVRYQIEKIEYARVYDRTFLGMGPLVEFLSDGQRDIMRGLQRRHTENLRRVIEHGVRAGVFAVEDVSIAAFAIISMCDGVITWYRTEGRLTIEATAELYARLALSLAGFRSGAVGPAPARRSPSPP